MGYWWADCQGLYLDYKESWLIQADIQIDLKNQTPQSVSIAS